jgi:hypothetical protein
MSGEYAAVISYREDATIAVVDALAEARGLNRTNLLREATRFYLDAQKKRLDLPAKENRSLKPGNRNRLCSAFRY